MAEDVNLADVLDTMNGPLNPEVTPEQVGPAVAAVLAYGGGDPVVMEAVIITVPVVPE